MSRARRYRIVSIVAVAMVGGFVALAACSNYGEGQRCESLNGNDDCVDGLQCTPKIQLAVPYNSSDRCCPVDRTQAKEPACAIPQSAVGGDSAPPPDTGPAPDATVGDAAEAGTDAAGIDAADAAEGG
jgi:hypothetical protein